MLLNRTMKWALSNSEFQYEEFIHIQFIYSIYGGVHTGKEQRQKTSSSRHSCISYLFLWNQEAEQDSSWHKEIIGLPNLLKMELRFTSVSSFAYW